MKVGRKVIFEGYVQGVGFRYRASRLAAGFEVGGYVRNLSDGTVEVVAEGEEVQVSGFIGAIREAMGQHIRKERETELPYSGSVNGFSIR